MHLGGALTRRFIRQSPLDGGSDFLWDEASGRPGGASNYTWLDLLSLGEVREVEHGG